MGRRIETVPSSCGRVNGWKQECGSEERKLGVTQEQISKVGNTTVVQNLCNVWLQPGSARFLYECEVFRALPYSGMLQQKQANNKKNPKPCQCCGHCAVVYIFILMIGYTSPVPDVF